MSDNEQIVYPTSAALAVEKRSDWVKPARYGLPWTRQELAKCCSMFSRGVPLLEMVKELRRPASGILAKLEALSFLRRNVASGQYLYTDYRGLVGGVAVRQRFNDMRADLNSPFCQFSLARLQDYRTPLNNVPLAPTTGEFDSLGVPTTPLPVGAASGSAGSLTGYASPSGIVGCDIGNIASSNSSSTRSFTMSQITTDTTVPVKSLDLVFGKDAKTMTDSDFLAAIRKLEEQIADLGKIKASSKKVKDTIKQLTEDLAKVIALYDAS